MASQNELFVARMKLEESLGEKCKIRYFYLLKQWFKMKSTREEFYIESKKLLTPEQIRLHNSFLLNLFNTCQFPIVQTPLPPPVIVKQSPPSHKPSPPREKERDRSKKEKSRARKRARLSRGFEPADSSDSSSSIHQTLPPFAFEEPLRYVHEELFLPDSSFILGRLLLCAWDHGLEGGSEQAADYIVVAVQMFLKNILTTIFSQRSGYKVREGRFQYAMGTSLTNPWLQNTPKVQENDQDFSLTDLDPQTEEIQVPGRKQTLEELEHEAIFEMACGTKPTRMKPPVSAFHALEALINTPSIVPSHRVLSVNVERIFARLSHPSHEELEKGN